MAGSKRRHTDTDNSDNKPSWDGNSITMRKWLNDIYLHLEEVDRDFETLVTSGYVLSKNITVVPTVHHAKALSDNNVLEFSSINQHDRFPSNKSPKKKLNPF